VQDSLTDRLAKQKTAGDSARQAYVQAMQERNAKIDAENLRNRVPRATAFVTGLRTEIVRKIGQMAKQRKKQQVVDDSLGPFPVPKEFDGSKGTDRDLRQPEDTAHAVWAEFVQWGADNGLRIEMFAASPTATSVRVTVG
jgi:hypothetical protein